MAFFVSRRNSVEVIYIVASAGKYSEKNNLKKEGYVMKKMLFLVLAMIMMMSMIVACGENSKILGTWVIEESGSKIEWIFTNTNALWVVSYRNDGSVVNVSDGTYSINGNEIQIPNIGSGKFLFRFEGNELIIDNYRFTRVSYSQIPPPVS